LISVREPNVLLVQPRFHSHSFWNYHETCAAVGARYSAAPLGLITVAALLPPEWPLRLIDRNIEELADEDLDWADLVMLGSMLPQQYDAKQVLARARARNKPTVIGGPDVSSSPAVYAEADFRIRGEAEDVMADFVAAWRGGARSGDFCATKFPDLRTSPQPRFDLLKLEKYLHVGVQYSRGCPFNCEFCDVIELNGRVPRWKTTGQMLGELEALHALGYRGHVDFVDDNLVGNPRAVMPFLAALGDWSEQRGHPFEFSSEVSLNLAENEEMLALMQRAGFFAVFVGIESPDPVALRSVRKLQNMRRNMAESIQRFYRAGIFVNAGFIIGFDAERESVAGPMVQCIEELAIPVCMVGLLYALPRTQLSRRLRAEGRLRFDSDRVLSGQDADQCTSGLNFQTLRPRREILTDYRTVLQRIYAPSSFFGRVQRLARALDLSRHRLVRPRGHIRRDLRTFGRITWRLGFRDRQVRGPFWRAVSSCLRRNPRTLRTVMSFAALYLHVKPFARFMDARLGAQIEGSVPALPALLPPVPPAREANRT
jgi:hypothetical protein